VTGLAPSLSQAEGCGTLITELFRKLPGWGELGKSRELGKSHELEVKEISLFYFVFWRSALPGSHGALHSVHRGTARSLNGRIGIGTARSLNGRIGIPRP
jgi:hypothetical protein